MAVAQYVLAGDGNGQYRFVAHCLTPVGNNSVGVSWSAAIVGAGLNKTVLTVGNGAGQISQADADAITAGTMLEVVGTFSDPADEAAAQAKLTTAANAAISEMLARLASKLKYFGYTQGVAS